MKFSLVRRLAACTMLFFLTAGTLFAADTNVAGGTTGFKGVEVNNILKNIDASADMFEYVGDNMIARGHVVLISGSMVMERGRPACFIWLSKELRPWMTFSSRFSFLNHCLILVRAWLLLQ